MNKKDKDMYTKIFAIGVILFFLLGGAGAMSMFTETANDRTVAPGETITLDFQFYNDADTAYFDDVGYNCALAEMPADYRIDDIVWNGYIPEIPGMALDKEPDRFYKDISVGYTAPEEEGTYEVIYRMYAADQRLDTPRKAIDYGTVIGETTVTIEVTNQSTGDDGPDDPIEIGTPNPIEFLINWIGQFFDLFFGETATFIGGGLNVDGEYVHSTRYVQPGQTVQFMLPVYADTVDDAEHYYEIWEHEDYYVLQGSDTEREDTYFGNSEQTRLNRFMEDGDWAMPCWDYTVPDREGSYYLEHQVKIDDEHWAGSYTTRLVVTNSPPTDSYINSLEDQIDQLESYQVTLENRISELQSQQGSTSDLQDEIDYLEDRVDQLEQEKQDLLDQLENGGGNGDTVIPPRENLTFTQKIQLLFQTFIDYFTGGTV